MTREWASVIAEHQAMVAALADQADTLGRITDTIIRCFEDGHRVYVLGNGGSAADAQHIAAELLGRFKRDRQALPAMALTTDTSTLTAIGNDLGYDLVFARQIEGLVRPRDVVWALSTSGNSPNVLAALAVAAENGATLVGFTGQTGGQMKGLCTHLFCAAHASSDRIQEAHQLAYHYVCEAVENALGRS